MGRIHWLRTRRRRKQTVEDQRKEFKVMDLSALSYSHIYWIFLLPLIGAGADIVNAVWERIAGKVL